LRLFSFGGYGLALAALALAIFGAYDSYPDQDSVFLMAKQCFSWRKNFFLGTRFFFARGKK